MFTIEELVDTVRDVAREFPDRVYVKQERSCNYTERDGSPGCLIGQAFARLDYPVAYGAEFNNHGILDVLPVLGLDGDNGCGDWLRYVQANQDEGMTWSDAVEEADVYYYGI